MIGRFLTLDPSHQVQAVGSNIPYLLPYLLGIPQGLNGFVYVGNDPLNFSDPTGLDRYNLCKGLSGVSLWLCKKYVDRGCSGPKNIVCCQAEKDECLQDIDWCKTDAEKKSAECHATYLKCISNTNMEC